MKKKDSTTFKKNEPEVIKYKTIYTNHEIPEILANIKPINEDDYILAEGEEDEAEKELIADIETVIRRKEIEEYYKQADKFYKIIDEHQELISKNSGNSQNQESIHSGHKGRLREKAHSNIDILKEHEILELLLNYGVVRKNTNPLAHDLINKYGSLVNVLDAGLPTLLKEPGLGNVTASLLSIIPKICELYVRRKACQLKNIETIGDAVYLFRSLFSTYDHEALIIVCMGVEDRIISIDKLAEGTRNHMHIDLSTMLKHILKHNPVKVIIAHNHLTESAMPSIADLRFTNELNKLLAKIGITLYEHFIVCASEEYARLIAGTIKRKGRKTAPLPSDLRLK